MKKLLLLLLAMVAFSATADAQGFLKKLKDKALEKAKDKIENKVERAVDSEMDAVLDGKKSEKTSKAKKQAEDAAEEVDDTPDAVAQNQKSEELVILLEIKFTVQIITRFTTDSNRPTAVEKSNWLCCRPRL